MVSCAWRGATKSTTRRSIAVPIYPPDTTSRRNGPLVLQLHGYNPPNPVYWDWWSADNRHGPSTPSLPITRASSTSSRMVAAIRSTSAWVTPMSCAACPRRSAVLRSTKTACISPVIPWVAGARGTSPRAIPICSPPSRQCSAAWTITRNITEEQLAGSIRSERFMAGQGSSWSMADSLINMPVYVHHGDADAAVNVEWSRYGVRMLQRWGYDLRYQEYPGKVHEALPVGNGRAQHSPGSSSTGAIRIRARCASAPPSCATPPPIGPACARPRVRWNSWWWTRKSWTAT